MPYRPSLSTHPITVLALCDGQLVEVRGVKMTFVCKPNTDKVFLTTGTDDGKAYTVAWNEYMNGSIEHTRSPPDYSKFYQHVRRGRVMSVPGQAEFTRAELTEVLASGDFYIG